MDSTNYVDTTCWKLRYKVAGSYTLNDGITSYHLMLKTITEEISAGNAYPPTTFTYQNIPFKINYCTLPEAVSDLRNSVYLKKVDNGYGGTTEYVFEPQRLTDWIYESGGNNYPNNISLL